MTSTESVAGAAQAPPAAAVRVAIVGATGYSGEELVRLLLAHPYARLTAVTSRQYAGQTVAQVFPKFASHPAARSLRFTEPNVALLAREAEVVFLALPHGVAAEFARPLLAQGCQVIDLSADFRLRSAGCYLEFYGREHPAPDGLWAAGGLSHRDPWRPPRRRPRVLPHEHSPAAHPAAAGRLDSI
jgi:N-acetyl-gamma-glutamyl-phosphate reductase